MGDIGLDAGQARRQPAQWDRLAGLEQDGENIKFRKRQADWRQLGLECSLDTLRGVENQLPERLRRNTGYFVHELNNTTENCSGQELCLNSDVKSELTGEVNSGVFFRL